MVPIGRSNNGHAYISVIFRTRLTWNVRSQKCLFGEFQAPGQEGKKFPLNDVANIQHDPLRFGVVRDQVRWVLSVNLRITQEHVVEVDLNRKMAISTHLSLTTDILLPSWY